MIKPENKTKSKPTGESRYKNKKKCQRVSQTIEPKFCPRVSQKDGPRVSEKDKQKVRERDKPKVSQRDIPIYFGGINKR